MWVYRKLIVQVVGILLGALVLISLLHWFVAEPFVVTGDSMEPNFSSGDFLVIDEISYYLYGPTRGDLVVFRYPLDPSMYFIKRLIGLPGDTVTITATGNVTVTPQGGGPALLYEPYRIAQHITTATSTMVLGDTEFFVLGDNRGASFDSRVWGPVPDRYLIGRVVARLFPPHAIGLFPGAYIQPSLTTSSTTIHTSEHE